MQAPVTEAPTLVRQGLQPLAQVGIIGAGATDTAPSSARRRSSCMPAAPSNRTQNAGERQSVSRLAAGVTIFCKKVLQRSVVEHGVRQQLLQPDVRALQPLEPLGLGLADDKAVELVDDLARGQVGQR